MYVKSVNDNMIICNDKNDNMIICNATPNVNECKCVTRAKGLIKNWLKALYFMDGP